MDKTEKFNTKIFLLCGDDEGDDDMVKDINEIEYKINSKRLNHQFNIGIFLFSFKIYQTSIQILLIQTF